MKIALLGATGFVGSAVKEAAELAGHNVVVVTAPRLITAARTTAALSAHASRTLGDVALRELDDCDAVINAAGAAEPGAVLSDTLVGANALLPALVAQSMRRVPGRRFIHISSAAVHGSAPTLDESADVVPCTPYGMSKHLGELAAQLCASESIALVVYRPTSVHGSRRALTRSLAAFSRSRLSSVARPGDRPSPQVLVENVASTAVFLAATPQTPPAVVLHPWEGVTTAALLHGLSEGAPPRQIPVSVARSLVAVAQLAGRLRPSTLATARRLDMLWFGQRQVPGWLDSHGPHPTKSWDDAYPELATALGRDDS